MELQFHPVPAHKLSANLYDIYHCCVYNEEPLIMDIGTVRIKRKAGVMKEGRMKQRMEHRLRTTTTTG